MTKTFEQTGLPSRSGRFRSAGSSSRILAAAASGICEQIELDGGDPDQVLALAKVNAHHLCDSKAALGLSNYVEMMEIASFYTGNDNFGLDYGQQFTPEMLGLIGRIALMSPTLDAALTNVAQLFRFHQQATETRLVRDTHLVRLEYRIVDGEILHRRQDAELTMGMFVNIVRSCLGKAWSPEEIHCEHPRPRDWRAHERAFDAPVYFAQQTNAVVLRADDLDRKMPAADLFQLASLTEELRRVAGSACEVSLLNQVRSEVRSALPDGGGTIELISERVGVPRWTLQRRLASEGYSFSEILDEAREDLAGHYIRRYDLPLTDIAFLLGYAELSAFSRAYKRWYGVPPQRHRQPAATS